MGKTSEPVVIELTDLKKRFGIGESEHFAIEGINLTVKKGEFIAIMGPSGSGKTTLLNILGLLDRSTDGMYRLDGREVASLGPRRQSRIRSQQIGFVFQSFNLISRLSILENVALPLTYKGISRARRIEMASNMLKNFGLQEREYYMPYQLSGGQAQRVAIARALVNDPAIILADEPTGNLDTRGSHIIMKELAELNNRGNTIIMVTHNPRLTSYASRVITMLDGKIDTDNFTHPEAEVTVPAKRPLNAKAAPKKKAAAKKKPAAKKKTTTKAATETAAKKAPAKPRKKKS